MKNTTAVKNMFGGRQLVIATRHNKEAVLQDLLEEHLFVAVHVPPHFDTDDFGTFSGEVEREQGPLDTARRKCVAAHVATGADLVLASEGSFGSHPSLGFIPADEEILLLKDFSRNLEIKARVVSTQTNFAANTYTDWEHVLYFASQVGFPSHALIVRSDKEDYTEIHKGINSWEALKESFFYFRSKSKSVYVETDMRACYNPTRMKVIAEAGQKLIDHVYALCPACQYPGFTVMDVVKGLPCNQCHTPTQSPKAYIYLCQHCGHSATQEYPLNKKLEEPMFCQQCNP